MSIWERPKLEAAEPVTELSAAEKEARILAIQSEMTSLDNLRRSAVSSGGFGGAGRIAGKKLGDISRKMEELKAELTKLGVESPEQE